MNAFAFALRRSLKGGFPLLLLLCAAAVFLASFSGAAGELPPAGVCDLDGSEASGRIVSCLTANGFQIVDDPQELTDLVETGALDCGVILPEGLGEMLRTGELEGAVIFLSSPSSYLPGLYRSHAAAALFSERAPYITAESFTGTEVTEEQVLETYAAMLEEGYAFSFQVTSAENAAEPESARSRSLVMGAVSVFLFAVLLAPASELMTGGFRSMAGRLGLRRALGKVLLPALAVRALCAAAAVSLGLLAAYLTGHGSWCPALIPAVFLYAALLVALALLLTALLPGRNQLHILLPLVLLLSLALCPIFTDVALLSPALAAVRKLLPTYWFWLLAERPLLWLPAAAAALPLSWGAVLLRFGLGGKYHLTRAG